jgi:tyrosinase
MAVALEFALHHTTEPFGRYVSWAPAPASLRVLDADGAEALIEVRLDSPGTAGRVVFAAERDEEAGDQLSLELPVDGTPVDFWVLGRFQSPSRADGDARIAVRPATGNVPLLVVPLMVRVRQDAQQLTFAERNRFLSALARLNASGAYQTYRDMKRDATTDDAHGFDGFLLWHRAYLLDLERELQAIDPSVTIPYWRFDQPAPRVFSQAFLGRTETAAGAVRFNPANPLSLFGTDGQIGVVRRPAFDTQLEPAGNMLGPVVGEQLAVGFAQPYARLRPSLENNPYGRAYTSFDVGFIREIGTAVRDPLFFLLHANVDRLWAKWQWFNCHFDLASQDTYFLSAAADPPGATPIGHNALDTMWPWNEVRTFPPPSTATSGPTPTVGALIDYQGVVNAADQLGYDYDDVPFESRT